MDRLRQRNLLVQLKTSQADSRRPKFLIELASAPKVILDLANEFTQTRNATKKDVSLFATATILMINLMGTIEGRI